MYELLIGLPPFYEQDDTKRMYERILFSELPSNPHLSEGAQKLLQSLLSKEPQMRPTISDVKNHAWLKDIPQDPPIKPSLWTSYLEKQGELRIQTTQQRRQSYYYESTV